MENVLVDNRNTSDRKEVAQMDLNKHPDDENNSSTDEENESIRAHYGSDKEESDEEDDVIELEEGETNAEESDVEEDSPPEVMMKYFSRRNTGLKHAVSCMNDECVRPFCRKMKNQAEHVVSCQNRILVACEECHKTLMLCTFHALYCKLYACEVPYCNAIRREAVKKRKIRMETGA